MSKIKLPALKLGALLGAGALVLALSGCGSAESTSGAISLTVGASPTPHAQILQFVQDNLASKAGLDLKIVEYQDYVKPNDDLKAGDLDANYYQTLPYLQDQTAKRGYQFDSGAGIHLEPLGIYSERVKQLSDVKEGDEVAIISDPTNQSRALALLAANDLIKLPADPAEQLVAKVQSSNEYNPKHLKFHEVDGPLLVQTLPDVAVGVINGNFALAGGKKPADAIVLEKTEGNPALNILVWAQGTQKLEAVKKLDELLHSPEVRQYIEQTWPDKSVIPGF